jgi:hypothetical protein
MSKYYTPEISEFHVGFEYELEEPDGTYSRLIHLRNSLGFLRDRFDEIRVKYLDREDIENCGWWYDPEFNERAELGKYVLFTHKNGDILIQEEYSYERKGTNYIGYNVLFDGKVKNISELRKLMKQLGINE